MNEPKRLTLIEQAEQEQCPVCSSEDSLSLKDGYSPATSATTW